MVLSFLFGTAALCGCAGEKEVAVGSGYAWMTCLDDDVHVSRLSIPGTHDSATKTVSGLFSGLARCQWLSIEEQLDMGVRAFDLRPTVTSEGLGNIFHGPFDTGVGMDDVMAWFDDYLNENPGEFIIAVLRFEGGRGGTEAGYIRYMRDFLARNAVYQARKIPFKPDLTLGESRGGILVISRNDLSPDSVIETAYTGWNHRDYIGEANSITGTHGTADIRIQDMYSRGDFSDRDYLVRKAELVKGMMDISADSPVGEWVINHCSGYTGGLMTISYKKNAANVHPEIHSYLTGKEKESGPLGIVMMDYVGVHRLGFQTLYGDLLLQDVIENNFRDLPCRRTF